MAPRFGGGLQKCCCDGVVFGWSCTDDDDAVAVLGGGEGGRDCAGSNGFHQCGDRARVTQPRAVIDIVRPKSRPDQFLEQIGFFIGAFRRAKSGNGVAAMIIAGVCQSSRCQFQCFLPARFPKMGRGVSGINLVIPAFADAVLADQRYGQAMGVVHIVQAETPLDAEPLFVGWSITAIDLDYPVIFQMVGDLAANAAERTDAVDGAVRGADADTGFVDHGGRQQCAGGAGLHTFATGHAGRLSHRVIEIENDFGFCSPGSHSDDIVALDLAAGADAQIAMDAGVKIDGHGRMARCLQLVNYAPEIGFRSCRCGRPIARISNLHHGPWHDQAGRRPAVPRPCSGLWLPARSECRPPCHPWAGAGRMPRERVRPPPAPCRHGSCHRADSPARAYSKDAGMPTPSRAATCQMVSSGMASTARPSRVKEIRSRMTGAACRVHATPVQRRYRIAISSTWNIRVAFGGITPPAPLAP